MKRALCSVAVCGAAGVLLGATLVAGVLAFAPEGMLEEW